MRGKYLFYRFARAHARRGVGSVLERRGRGKAEGSEFFFPGGKVDQKLWRAQKPETLAKVKVLYI